MSNRKFDAMHSLKEHFSEDQTKVQPKTLDQTQSHNILNIKIILLHKMKERHKR